MSRVAVIQTSPDPAQPGASRAAAAEAALAALLDGADVVVLPELAVPGYSWRRELIEQHAEPIDGPTVASWRAAAREGGGLIAGGFAERDGDRLFNTAVLVGAAGVILHYRKLHLFAGEDKVFTPGDLGLPVAGTEFGTIGLCVCYDLRFVEVLRGLSLSGAQLVCVPTAWVTGFDSQAWDSEGFCPQARNALMQSNLDSVYIACASQSGEPGEHRFLGSSVIGDPRGICLAGPMGADTRGASYADFDATSVAEAANRGAGIRPGADRRTDVYRLVLGEESL